jgi:hypothetical protein
LGQAERLLCVCVAIGIVPCIFFTAMQNKARRAIQGINKLNEHSLHPLKCCPKILNVQEHVCRTAFCFLYDLFFFSRAYDNIFIIIIGGVGQSP